MPSDTTKGKLKHKSSRREGEELRFDGSHAREIEQKRNNGQISCAECRRLKIKCDKQIPCQSCQRRGCAALCPNGSLATGQGTRFVLAATEHLHRQIANRSGRIRQLEDALGLLQSRHSAEPHPLLRDDLCGADQKDEISSIAQLGDNVAGPSNPPEILDAFGTLSINDHGISRFFGPTGGHECLLTSDKAASDEYADASSPESGRDSMSPGLPQEFRMFSQAFPFTPMGPTTATQDLIESHLPPLERANFLTQTYFEQASWLFRSVPQEQVMEELLPIYYSNSTATPPDEPKGAHELGLLLLIFAIGALVDLTQDASNPEAEHYHQLACASICLQPVMEKPTLVTVQALHLLSAYNAMSGNELAAKDTSMETTWSLNILAAHLSQSIGLHRDSAKWGLPAKVVHRRRLLFWDLFVADAWSSLHTGRPPTFSLAYTDCHFPEPPASAENDGESGRHAEFAAWYVRYAADCVAEVATRTLMAEAPTYAVIMEIDRKVREYPFPDVAALASGTSPPPITEEPLSLAKSMGRLVISHSKETLLLYIHRSFFAQAIIENPVNPLKSAYAPSFLAAYRASQTILRTIQQAFQECPNLCARFWTVWTFAFSAAIVFGTIVTRGPQSPLASNAMKELDDACLLFSRAATHSRRAAKALPIISKLREKAHVALAAAQNERPPQQLGQQWSVKVEQDDDELDIFAGRTRFLSVKRPTGLPADYPEASSNSNTYPVAGSTEQPTAQIYRPEPAAEWVHSASDRGGRFDMHHSSSTAPSASTNISSQSWRQPQSSDYPYTPLHHVSHSTVQLAHHAPLPAVGSSTYWAPASETSQQYSQPLLTAPHFQSHAYQYSSPSVAPYHGHQSQPVPTEIAGLGLVSQDSRLDERWTSFMRDSGYFDGVGYRTQ
ncbi:fungal-specific transcription factor domain-containing protein [Suillus subaureus]|uniref:Fungal-specific transcription factor domain-containing protein n=1 Tax=Suillus subaureus TaxID=48587 RepID=A0A9P7EB26_9AGAM|nr:fungal-specific transcription factor domain-containing protein [Suillus subaureus]KAG1816497.1 fungal-specific transcription factor domain-containing protein [Suillus subaureus]